MPAFGPCRRACGCAGLFFCRRTPQSCLSSSHRSLPRLSSRLPSFFPSSVFLLPARISHCPHFPLPVSPSARVSLSPCLSQPASRQLCQAVLLRLYSVWFFFCHFLFSVHRPSPAACCPSPIVYPLLPAVYPLPLVVYPLPLVVHPLPLVVHRSLRRSSFIARRLLAVARTPSPAAPHRTSFRCRSVRITAFVSAESRPACLRELLAVSFRSGFRRSVFPQKCVRPPYLGRRAVSDKITPCILLSGAIFPARPAILLTIWQRLPFGTTFVQIQGVTGAPDPQGGRIPAARKENGKNINN